MTQCEPKELVNSFDTGRKSLRIKNKKCWFITCLHQHYKGFKYSRCFLLIMLNSIYSCFLLTILCN